MIITQESKTEKNWKPIQEPLWTRDIKVIQDQLPYDEKTIQKLLDIDRGETGSNMFTLGLQHVVMNKCHYSIGSKGLEVSKELFAIDLEERAASPKVVIPPLFVEIEAVWDKTPIYTGNENNILGDNGSLFLNTSLIKIPSVVATDETLAYYGATLVSPQDIVRFPDEHYPLFRMNVGEDYVENFIMTEQGGGLYLEFHHDKPHFHMPLKGSGNYLLARWNDNKSALQITGFRIPDGYAVYSKKGAIHCDACLKGDLLVGYTIAEDCSTVLWRDNPKNNTFVAVEYEDY